MQSQYASAVPAILAEMEEARQEDEAMRPDQDGEAGQKVIYVYPFEGGGLVFTDTPIEDEPDSHIVNNRGPEPTTRREPPYFLHFLLILLLFVLLDSADSALLALFVPTVTVAITPQVKTESATAIIPVGSHADVHGRVLAPLTLTQSQTVRATGRGHQQAVAASGQLTFYNGQSQSVTVASGTVFTAGDGIQVVTLESAVTPAADPSTNPPAFGQLTVPAQAVQKGASGNIGAYAISGSCCASSVIVKNLAPFRHGQDARDFPFVTKGDIQGVVGQLTPLLLQSERAALTSQLTAQEALLTPACTPTTSADHAPGDEAATVSVTVSETCKAVAYDRQELESRGIAILTSTCAASSPAHFQRVGEIHLVVVSQTISGERASLTVRFSGIWVYQLNAQQLTASIAGRPRLYALHFISGLPGVQTVSITGVQENQALPTDAAHIRILVFFPVLPPIQL
jgi:hypothetical protein